MIYAEKSASSLLFCQHIQVGREMRKVMFFAPMIMMIVVEIAAFIIGKKLFGSWTWKDKILLPVCSVLGLVSSVVLIGLLDP